MTIGDQSNVETNRPDLFERVPVNGHQFFRIGTE
jgi:hypothetical protein